MKNKKFIYRTVKVKDYLANKYHDIHLESNDKIYYMGFYGVRNWGDAINSELIRLLSGKTGVIIPFGKPKQYEREREREREYIHSSEVSYQEHQQTRIWLFMGQGS